jgi:hypothetical protein
MTKEEILRGLECTISKTVSYHLGEGGLWYLVDRESGLRNIPRLVDYVEARSMLSSRDGPLTIPLGMGANRQGIKIDFQHETTAHFLIGGTTGAGKTNAVHTMICSLIQRDPREVKLVLVDLKQIEFTRYAGLPHLDRQIVTEPADVLPLVQAMWAEVQRRMGLLRSAKGVNHVREWNRLHRPSERLPYIIVIVDELAVIMLDKTLRHKSEIESYLARIASVGRASGVHLVLATQRPDKNVLTPLITANFSGRIGLACASVFDSMIIIGNGDACFQEAVPAGRAILSHGRHRTPFQIAYLKDSLASQIVEDALGGKFGSKRMYHDVTMEELARYSMAYFGGLFNKTRLYSQFHDRGISGPEIDDLAQRYVCDEKGACPGPANCDRTCFSIDDQAFCLRQLTRGTFQPLFIINCANFSAESAQVRAAVMLPDENTAKSGAESDENTAKSGCETTSQRAEGGAFLLEVKGLDQPSQPSQYSQPSQHSQPGKPQYVVLTNCISSNASRRNSRAEKLTDALVWLLDHPDARPVELADAKGYSRTCARSYIKELTESGRLRRNGHGWERPLPAPIVIDADDNVDTAESDDAVDRSEVGEVLDADPEWEDWKRRTRELLGEDA